MTISDLELQNCAAYDRVLHVDGEDDGSGEVEHQDERRRHAPWDVVGFGLEFGHSWLLRVVLAASCIK